MTVRFLSKKNENKIKSSAGEYASIKKYILYAVPVYSLQWIQWTRLNAFDLKVSKSHNLKYDKKLDDLHNG